MSNQVESLIRGEWKAFLRLRNDDGEHLQYPSGFNKEVAESNYRVGSGNTGHEDVSFLVFELGCRGKCFLHGFEPSSMESFLNPADAFGFTFIRYEDLMFNHWFCFGDTGWADTGCRVRPSDRLHYVLTQANSTSGIIAAETVGATKTASQELVLPRQASIRSGPRFTGENIGAMILEGFNLAELY